MSGTTCPARFQEKEAGERLIREARCCNDNQEEA